MTEQKIQVGDKVRVTRNDFRVGRVDSLWIEGPDGSCYSFRHHDIEILEKRKLQVGDVISSRRKFVNLPEGSVVTNGDGDALIVRHGRTYAPGLTSPAVLMPGLRFADFAPGCTPYTVIYIP